MLTKISIELQTFSLQVIALQENACSSALKDEHVHFCRSEKEGKKKKTSPRQKPQMFTNNDFSEPFLSRLQMVQPWICG